HTDAIFHAGEGIKKLALGEHDSLSRRDQPVDPHQRRAAHGFGDVVVNASFGFAGHGCSYSSAESAHSPECKNSSGVEDGGVLACVVDNEQVQFRAVVNCLGMAY